MNIKKILLSGIIAVFGIVSFITIASAESPRPKRSDVMEATPDTLNATWVTGISQDGGSKGQSIAMTDFSYYSFRNWWDQDLSDVTKIQASFLLDAVNAGGSPRISLEIDPNGDGSVTDDYTVIYLDPAHCSDAIEGGWLYADFTGDLTNCTIYDSTGASYASDGTLSAWSKVVAAYPDAKVWFSYLIQDATTGTNYVDRIKLDSSFLTKQP